MNISSFLNRCCRLPGFLVAAPLLCSPGWGAQLPGPGSAQISLQSSAGVTQAAPLRTNAVVVSSALVERLAGEAQTNNPALRAANARAQAARHNVDSVRKWDDPMVKLGFMGAERERREDDGDILLGVEQKLPLFGKPQQMRRVAQAEADTERHQALFRSHQLRQQVASQLVKVALAERLVDLAREDIVWLDTIVRTTEEKYRNATASQFEVLQAQNERATRYNALHTAETNVWYERTALNRILARPTDSPWPRFFLPNVADPLPPANELVHHALGLAPQLQVMGAGVRQAEASVELARKQRYPEFSAGAEVRQFSGNGEAREGTVMLSMSVPWGNRRRYRADVQREQSKLDAAQLDVADMQLGISDEVNKLASKIDSARREAITYRDDVIPRSAQALAAAHAGWAANRGMLRDVLEARRMVVDGNTMYARAVAEQYAMIADLILHCGLHEFGTMESLKLSPALKLP